MLWGVIAYTEIAGTACIELIPRILRISTSYSSPTFDRKKLLRMLGVSDAGDGKRHDCMEEKHKFVKC